MVSSNKIRLAILDDHQSIIDGYLYRLGQDPGIEVTITSAFADEFDQLLNEHEPNVLILDVFVPISPDNPNFYPILETIPRWLQKYPDLAILVISMYHTRSLVRAVMEAGASGYILKEDRATIEELTSVVRSVASGGIHLSRRVHDYLFTEAEGESLLTSRQMQVLSLCAAYPDASTAELAKMMEVAHSTLRNLLSSSYLRLDVHNRTAAIHKARQLGLIPPQRPPMGP